jgi:hypothetical protein
MMSALTNRAYNAAMRRAMVLTLLAGAVVLGATLQAQAAGGGTRGGFAHAPTAIGGGARPGVGSGAGASVGSGGRYYHSYRKNNGNYNNGIYYPFYDGIWYGDEPYAYSGPDDSGPRPMPPMMMPASISPPAPERIPSGPKMTELPVPADAGASKPLPAAMFILTNGERIEARQYLVTCDQVRLTVDRQQRLIPLAMLDINATLAADRQRGIDLRIPEGRSEISLGF